MLATLNTGSCEVIQTATTRYWQRKYRRVLLHARHQTAGSRLEYISQCVCVCVVCVCASAGLCGLSKAFSRKQSPTKSSK